MYNKQNENCAVLNDYDLAHLRGRPRPSGNERTGTMPFMALDLLTKQAWEGKVSRLYRHDCESFLWVLLWICSRYDNGREISNPPLDELLTTSFEECFKNKRSIAILVKRGTPSYGSFWTCAFLLVQWVLNLRTDLEVADIAGDGTSAEPTMDDVIDSIRKIIEGKGFSVKL
jgi:hypothetical protein